MLRNKRRRTTRSTLALTVALGCIGATVVVLLASGSGPRGARGGGDHPASAALAGPLGLSGRWKLVFDDEFNGSGLNTSVWNTHNGWTNQNGVTDSASNVTVSGGHAILTLASPSSGAEIGTQSFGLAVGQFAQARIEFPGSGATID
ncbi:MAG TPA: hypothetical protein VFN36_05340, partial [Solirubrobacteraceae bacterium]|nr:hypothetical protein [Solirubrobacteraceae bacterium]